jgi:predicted transcriptional regulator
MLKATSRKAGRISMACKSTSDWKMDGDQEMILDALARMTEPASGKDVAGESGVDAKVVSKKMKDLKTHGFVDSPVRCKYAITDLGRKHSK